VDFVTWKEDTKTMIYPMKDLVFTQLVKEKKVMKRLCHRVIKVRV